MNSDAALPPPLAAAFNDPESVRHLFAMIEQARQTGYGQGYTDGSAGGEPARDLREEIRVRRLSECDEDGVVGHRAAG